MMTWTENFCTGKDGDNEDDQPPIPTHGTNRNACYEPDAGPTQTETRRPSGLKNLFMLNCLLLNAQSVLKDNTVDLLHSYMIARKIDLAFITESWLSPNTATDAELSCNNRFQVFRCDRGTRGGGVLVLARETLKCVPVHCELINDIELVALDLVWKTGVCRYICVCFTPTSATEYLVQKMTSLCETLEKLCEEDTSTCIVGDFNLPSIDWKHVTCPGKMGTVMKESLFLDLCMKMGFVQLVEKPTRQASSNIRDLVLSNDDTVSNVCVVDAPLKTDHSCVCFTVGLMQDPTENEGESAESDPGRRTVTDFDYKRGDYEMIKLNLSLTN